MKTMTAFAGGALAAFAIFVTSPAFAEQAWATRNVNVRSGPGIAFGVVDQLQAEEPVNKGDCNEDRSWCYVRHDGENGWVAAVFLTTNNPNQPTPPPQDDDPASSENDFRATTQLNIRTGPSTDYAIVDRLERNEEVKRGQCTTDGEWCYVNHDGADGWVAARFLEAIEPSGPPPTQTPGQGTRIAIAPVNVRTGPSTDFTIVDRLDRNERVEVAQCTTDRDWCYVSHDGPDGWVAANFLRLPGSGGQGPGGPNPGNPDPGNPNPPMVTQKVGTAIAGMPVRGAPTLFTTTVGRLERGDTINVEECTDDGYWCHVVDESIDGWVPGAFLQISEIEVPAATNTAEVARATPIRRLPGGQSAIVGMLQAGSEVTVNRCGPAGNYCEVSYNQLSGWVEADALRAPGNAQPQQPVGQQPDNTVCFTGFGGIEFCFSQQ